MSKLYNYQNLKPLIERLRKQAPISDYSHIGVQYQAQKAAFRHIKPFSEHVEPLLFKRLADLRHERRELPLAYTLGEDANVVSLSSYRILMSYTDELILQVAHHQISIARQTFHNLLTWLKTGCSLIADHELFNHNPSLYDWYRYRRFQFLPPHQDKNPCNAMLNAILSGNPDQVAHTLYPFQIDEKLTKQNPLRFLYTPYLRVLTDDVFSTYQLTHRLWQDHYNRLTGNIKRDRAAYRHYVIDLPNLLRRTASNPLTKLLSIYWPLDNLAYYFSSVQELRHIRRGGRHDRETRVFCRYRVHESRKRLLVSYHYLPATCRKLLSSRGLNHPVEQLRQTSNPPSLASLQPVFGVLRRLGIQLADQYHLGHRVYYRYLT